MRKLCITCICVAAAEYERRIAMYFPTKKEIREARKSGFWKFVPVLETFMIAAMLQVIFLIAAFIYISAPYLGVFFIPTFFSHFLLWSVIGYWLCTRVERLKERELMGDEWYFNRYPLERWLVSWNKLYRNWQIRRIQRIREERKQREANRGVSIFADGRGKSSKTRERALAMRGPELDLRQQKKELKREARALANKEKEQEKAKKDFLKRVTREYGKNGPDLSDDAFACWCETSPEKTQFVSGKRAENT